MSTLHKDAWRENPDGEKGAGSIEPHDPSKKEMMSAVLQRRGSDTIETPLLGETRSVPSL
jgi:hypothetical protein